MQGIDFTQVLSTFVVLLVSLTVHEAAHAWSADRLGDSTARLLGRVSFNPAVHVDPIGTLLFPLIALTTGAPLLGWAKPVPVNTFNLGHGWQRKYMVIAAAGPASNLVMAVVAAVALHALLPGMSGGVVPRGLLEFLYQAVDINVLLAVFNMVPVPPLDGGNVLSGLLRGSASEAFNRLRPYGFFLLYALMFSGALFALINPPRRIILSLLGLLG